MDTFSSRRERNLWLGAGVVLGLIAATLGLVGLFRDLVQDQRLVEHLTFWAAMGVFATIGLRGVMKRPNDGRVVLGVGVAATVALVVLRMLTPEARTHMVEYGVLTVFVYEALKERAANGRSVPVLPLVAFALPAAVGVLDEGTQLLIPSRVFDPVDIAFNTAAAGATVLALWVLGWIRARLSG